MKTIFYLIFGLLSFCCTFCPVQVFANDLCTVPGFGIVAINDIVIGNQKMFVTIPLEKDGEKFTPNSVTINGSPMIKKSNDGQYIYDYDRIVIDPVIVTIINDERWSCYVKK